MSPESVRQSIIELANDNDVLLSVMAEISTKGKYSVHTNNDLPNWKTELEEGSVIVRSPLCRFNYYSGNPAALFVDGLTYYGTIELVKFICEFDRLEAKNLAVTLTMEGAKELIPELFSLNYLILE